MDRTEAKESRYTAPGAFGSAPLVATDAAPAGLGRRIGRGVISWLKAATLTLGIMYVVGWVASVMIVSGLSSPQTYLPNGNAEQRTAAVAPMRAFVAPRDPSITPDAAAVAFFSLQPRPTTSPSRGFTNRDIPERVTPSWRTVPMPAAAFQQARQRWDDIPDPTSVITRAAGRLTSVEREVLRRFGTDPVWLAFDRVAAAPAVDLIAGQFTLPLGEDARAYARQLIPFAESRRLAAAGVARAAWHVSEGRWAAAEAALRSVVSYGFALVDNGPSTIDRLVGTMIVNTGRYGLEQLFTASRDPRLAVVQGVEAAAREAALGSAPAPQPGLDPGAGFEERRRALIALAESPNVSKGVRFDALSSLQWNTCSSARELVRGPGAETRAAFEAVRRNYAPLPGDRALVDLIESDLAKGLPGDDGSAGGPLIVAVQVASRMYFNPRLGACAATIALGR